MTSVRRLYDWVLGWAETPFGMPALAALAVAEAIFFPFPPDLLLAALCLSIPANAWRYAATCSAASVIGGMGGYAVGLLLLETVGRPLIQFYGFSEQYLCIQDLYRRHDAWAVTIAGFTPIPYKVFAIAAGAFRIDLGVFILASALGRSARFFLLAALLHRFGYPIRRFIDRYFSAVTAAFAILLVGGFAAARWLF
ncbi:MAG: YqaA family protein [Nitrospinota bacterium]